MVGRVVLQDIEIVLILAEEGADDHDHGGDQQGEDVADDLTTTEFTMAMLACRGWTNAEIARHMEVSPGTVKNRLSGVYAKLGIGTRAELVAHMLR